MAKRPSVAAAFSTLGKDIAEIGSTCAQGDWKTKLSFLIFGIGPILRGQIVKGLTYLGLELLFIWYMISFGWKIGRAHV